MSEVNFREETWRPIHGYEGFYEVSDKGRVRSLPRRAMVRGGATRSVAGIVMTLTKREDGYLAVSLYRDNKSESFLAHRLVASAFMGHLGDGQEVNHKDGDKGNNSTSNLEIVSRQQNIDHAVASGLIDNKGERNAGASISEDLVRQILADHAAGLGYKKLSKKYGVSWGLARNVAARRTWRHVVIPSASST
ncbi:MAG TPA: NUMOD4 motif-containing HNH endonuclease [Aquabacterium sp.]|nr:NUMOD4 motif-containing HNH endonuclease [Aquabacterium sp.]